MQIHFELHEYDNTFQVRFQKDPSLSVTSIIDLFTDSSTKILDDGRRLVFHSTLPQAIHFEILKKLRLKGYNVSVKFYFDWNYQKLISAAPIS